VLKVAVRTVDVYNEIKSVVMHFVSVPANTSWNVRLIACLFVHLEFCIEKIKEITHKFSICGKE